MIVGQRPDLLAAARAQWLPATVLAWGEPTASPLWEGRADGLAYLCRRFACREPVGDPEALTRQLGEPAAPREGGAP